MKRKKTDEGQLELQQGEAVDIASALAGTSWDGFAPRKAMTDAERQQRHRAAMRELGEIPPCGNPDLRERCRTSLLAFATAYCLSDGEHKRMLKRLPSRRMLGFVSDLEKTIVHGGEKHVRWPRGKGKSTWVKIGAMWAMLYGYRRFCVMISATKPMAEEATAEIWRRIAEDPLFLRDFPEFAVPLADVAFTSQRMRLQTYHGTKTHIADSVRFAYKRFAIVDGYPNTGCIIAARGADQAIRGLNIDSNRPDFLFIDDPQDDVAARSPRRVSEIEDRINGALIGLGETSRRIAAVMASTPIEPDDVSERFADADRHPEWITSTERFVVSWGREDLVTAYLAELRKDHAEKDPLMRHARAFYEAHRAEIEEGAEMMDPDDFDCNVEMSAYHHALNMLDAMKRKRFESEMQMRPTRSQGVYKLDPTLVASRTNGFPFGVVPPKCSRGCVAFVDINDIAGLRWGIMAFGPGRVAAVVAYGKYPRKGRLYPEGTPPGAIPMFLGPAIRDVANAITECALHTPDGKPVKVKAICFDGGWQTATVAHECARLNAARGFDVGWSKGFSWRSYRPGHASEDERGEWSHVARSDNGRFLAFNADYWRETAQTAFLNAPLTPSSCSFWGSDIFEHYDFACEVCAERLVAKFTRPDNQTQWDWKKIGENHFGDVLSGCMMFASKRGIYDSVASLLDADGDDADVERTVGGRLKRRKRVKYVYGR